MNTHFLTDITIQQFKCFNNFTAEGFKRINLIGGANNIGKTVFLEAAFINTNGTDVKQLIDSLIWVKFARENLNLIHDTKTSLSDMLDSAKEYHVKSNLCQQHFKIEEANSTKQYVIAIQSAMTAISIIINAQQLSLSKPVRSNCFFIDNFGIDNKELEILFQVIQRMDRESELNKLLHEFDPSIASFKMIGDKPQCKVNGEYRDITELGSGLSHYIGIICALHACQNGYLFIDELGNGIHYSQIVGLWNTIFTLSNALNCQVFATTHSKETLEAFAKVAKKHQDTDLSYTTLVKNRVGEIKALTLDCRVLLKSLEQEHEIR